MFGTKLNRITESISERISLLSHKATAAEVSDTTGDDKRRAARQINNSSLVINFH